MLLQVGVKVLIRNTNDNYLFIKRTELLQDETEVSWDIPGGRIEPDEPLHDALVREVKEETGLNLEATPNLVTAQDIFVPHKDLHVVRLTYIAEQAVEAITLSDEHQEIVWLTLDEAKQIMTEPFLKETLSLLS